MRIPPDAIIAPEKVTGYLLTSRPKDDKSRFLARSGFDATSATLLEAEIRRLTAEADAVAERIREHGTFYTVTGEIAGPAGVALPVKLVWLHRVDGVCWFVTLVPQAKRDLT
jgi:hypothetical protein